jgi:hypothetical protein
MTPTPLPEKEGVHIGNTTTRVVRRIRAALPDGVDTRELPLEDEGVHLFVSALGTAVREAANEGNRQLLLGVLELMEAELAASDPDPGFVNAASMSFLTAEDLTEVLRADDPPFPILRGVISDYEERISNPPGGAL